MDTREVQFTCGATRGGTYESGTNINPNNTIDTDISENHIISGKGTYTCDLCMCFLRFFNHIIPYIRRRSHRRLEYKKNVIMK